MKKLLGFVMALVLGASAAGWAQGVQTGTLTGTVRDQGDLVLPGVTVTVTSPALQGVRTVVTDENGVYTIPGLPPGDYTVRFELSGMSTAETTHTVGLGQPARVDATMKLQTVTELVQVTAETPNILSTVQGGANYRTEELNKLATGRTIAGIAELAPGLTDNTPNAGQVTIGGGFAYDNQMLVDGVDVADNLFGSANNLFIEDAIQEVQVLTGGISAEYGRFGGGVVNAITKSGGNDFSGTGRINFYSPSWTKETPFEVSSNTVRQEDVQQNYEGTFGGPLVRDRLWFFTAGRWQEASTPAPLPETAIPFSTVIENKRGELKFTGTVATNHTLQGSYLNNVTNQLQTALPGLSIDEQTVVDRQTPNNLWVVAYRGVVGSNLFANLQWSRRKFGFRNAGGTETALLRSPFRTRGVASGVPGDRFYNAPYFDANDPENRNNRQVAGSLNWFLTTQGLGSHDLKVGYENFTTTRTGGNSQTATGFVFRSDYLISGGRPQLDSQGRVIPIFVPGVSRLENWLPTRGAQIDIVTNSFYVHDRWTAGPRWTFDVGTRFEMVNGDATGDITTVDTRTIVPRLGASYDVTGEGKWIVQATYAHYAGKYSETQFADNTDVGNPSLVVYQYSGPAGQGVDFAPGVDRANYTQVIGGGFPTANIFLDEDLHSPVTKEFTASLGTPIGDRGAAKVTYQWRAIGGFIEDFINDPSPSGKIPVIRNGVNFGTFDRVVIRNSDDPKRDYQAMVFQANHRLRDRVTINGHWTLQLTNDGTFEGEATNQPGINTVIGDFPELYVLDRNNPDGRLNDFQRHKVRLWTTYTLGLSRFGDVDLGLLYRYNSPLTFSLFASGVPFTAIQRARDPGYAIPPASQTLFFDERGSERQESSHLADFSATYSIPVFRDLRPWIKFELFNIFNNQSLVQFNTQVTRDLTGPVDANGLQTQFVRGARFGEATAITHFPRSATNFAGQNLYARTFFLSLGVRF
jgi:hypothetical protein